MKWCVTIFFILTISNAYSQTKNHQTVNKSHINNSRDFSNDNDLLEESKVGYSSESFMRVLDSAYIFYYSGANRDIPTNSELDKYYVDQYGNDSLVFHFKKEDDTWVKTNKTFSNLSADGSYTIQHCAYSWNSIESKWILNSSNFDYRRDGVNTDSLIRINYNNQGNIDYGFKTIISYNAEKIPDFKINQQIGSGESDWSDVFRSEYYYNENRLLERGEQKRWDKTLETWEKTTYWDCKYDSSGFESIVTTFNWDPSTEKWKKSHLKTYQVENSPYFRKITHDYERDEIKNDWISSQMRSEDFNELNQLTFSEINYWSTISEKWLNYQTLEITYNEATGKKSQELLNLTLDEEFTYTNAKYEGRTSYEYDESGNLINKFNHSRYDEIGEFELDYEVVYKYMEIKVIIDKPHRPEPPSGPDTICVNSTDVVYKSKRETDIKSFDWQIIPKEAGAFETDDSLMYLSLTDNYFGSLGISVAGVNGFGIGEYSDTLAIYIKPAPTKPSIPEGPDYLNQFSGIVEYAVNQDQNASAYNWHLEPIEAGELNSSDNKVTFNYNFEFEGEFTLTVDASNECGPSGISDALLVRTEIIDTTTLLPPQLPIPLGPDTVCFNDTDIIFKTIKHDTISSYLWNLIPENTGTMNQKDTILSLDLNEVYSGNLKISVAGQNILGRGEYSDTLEIYIKDVPAKPTKISGPEELNQYSEQNEYSIEKVSFANQYNWNLYPLEAGELISNGIEAQFEIQEGFEGDVEISVSTANECGQSEPSDLKLVSVKIISGLINDFDEYGIKVFPNPALNEINISNQEFIEIKCINIINAQGITTWSKTDLSKVKAHTIPIDFPPGIYTILIEIENNLICEKILVE